jgi:hypothetical protein
MNSLNNLVSLFEYIEKVKIDGNVFILKVDGERENNYYSILIISSSNSFETLRSDGNDLYTCLVNVFEKYKKIVS